MAQFRFTFKSTHNLPPYILFEVARPSVTTSKSMNITYPLGSVSIPDSAIEICGWSSERQDSIITPITIASFAQHFKGYFCARFEAQHSQPIFGAIQNGSVTFPLKEGSKLGGSLLSAFAILPKSVPSNEIVINLRIGTSFISEEQARKNLDTEIPNRLLPSPIGTEPSAETTLLHRETGTIENTAYLVRKSWTDIMDRMEVLPYADEEPHEEDERAEVDLAAFWTGVARTLQVCHC